MFIFKTVVRNMASYNRSYDVIVVGLGASGVAAASVLAKAGKRVLGLEADDKVGGRVSSQELSHGSVEIGAEWVLGEKGNHVYDTALSNGIKLIRQDLKYRLYTSKGKPMDSKVYNDIIEFCVDAMEAKPDGVDDVGNQISVRLQEYLKNKPEYLSTDQHQNLIDFLNTLVSNYESTDSWREPSANTAYEGKDGRQSMSWGKNGYKTFFDILLNRYKEGPGLPNFTMKLKAPVEKINWSEKNVTVTCRDGTHYKAENIIVTVSLGVLKETHLKLFHPTLPAYKIKAINSIPMGAAGKIVLSFSNQWWATDVTFFGFLWEREDRSAGGEDDGWLQNISGASRSMGSDYTLTLWLSGEASRIVEGLPIQVVQAKALGLLRKFMGITYNVPEPTSIMRSFWNSNPYTRGSYSFDSNYITVCPGAREDLAAPLANAAGEPRVFFAGEATNRTQFSTVHGASESGVREANNILKLSLSNSPR